MNKVILKGRVTRDIEMRCTNSSEPIAIANFGVAVNRMKKGEVDFFNCYAFGATADFLNKYFVKGQEILIEGRIQIDKYDVNGENKQATKIMVDRVEFCGGKNDIQTTKGENESQEEEDNLPF